MPRAPHDADPTTLVIYENRVGSDPTAGIEITYDPGSRTLYAWLASMGESTPAGDKRLEGSPSQDQVEQRAAQWIQELKERAEPEA